MSDYPQKHLDLGISQSALKVLHRSPRDYWWKYIMGHEKPESEALRNGQAMNCAVLMPHRWSELIAVEPDVDGRTKEGKGAKLIFADQSKGKTIIDSDAARKILAGAEQVREHPIAVELLHKAHVEGDITWTDQATGVQCRGRYDALCCNSRVLLELKKVATRGLPLEVAFRKQVQDLRYDVQLTMYRDGLKENGIEVETAIWLAVEEDEPNLVDLYAQDPEDIEAARFSYRHDLELFKTCCKTGKWPGLERKIKTLSMAKWARDERAKVREGE